MAAQDTLARLPEAVRDDLREPLGPVFTDAERLLSRAGSPLVAVGDVVTYHLVSAGQNPDVAVIDGRTKREAVDDEVGRRLDALPRHETVPNEAGTLSAELVDALADALDADGQTVIEVDGEEDLAALPAVLLAPAGAAVVYGQPDEGMVRIAVGEDTRRRVREILERFETDDRLWDRL